MIRPTRRGIGLLAVAVAAAALAVGFGPRSLGAVVVPAVVALAAGVVQALLAPRPTVERILPPDGHAGRESTVVLGFDVDDPYPATVDDRLPSAVSTADLPAETVLGRDPVRYRVRLERRGRHRVGPATVRSTDALGLVAGTRTVGEGEGEGENETVLVYPPVRPLPTAAAARLRSRVAGDARTERDEFDGLREYVRGDALRNLNWKVSAKRDDLIVTKYVGARPERTVTVAVGGDPGDDDEMAAAAASVVSALHELGVVVSLRTPDGELEAPPDDRDRALAHLATVGPGAVPSVDAPVVVEASGGTARIAVDGVETTFDGPEEANGGAPEVAA